MKHLDARGLEGFGTHRRTARGGGDKLDALLDDKINNVGALDVGQGHVHAKGLIGEVPHFGNLFLDGIEFTRSGLNDPHTPGIADRRRQLRPGYPAHGSLDNRVIRTQYVGNAIVEGLGGHRSFLVVSIFRGWSSG